MKFFFFDTETTGLPHDYNASYTDIDNWPRLVQLAWIVYDKRNAVVQKNFIIKPIGFAIPKSATDIHGISTKKALESGHKIEKVLNDFLEDAQDIDAIIGHNIGFGLKVVQSELFRLSIDNDLEHADILDTMHLATDFCKIPNKQYGYRYPKLIELYNKLFSESFDNMHDAMADIEATARCFWAMLDRGIIDKEKYPCLLSEQEKNKLAERYNEQAEQIIWWSRKGTDKDREELYIKSAKLGNTKGMYNLASINRGGIRKDYQTAKYWLEKIVELSRKKKVSYYEEALQGLIRIYKDLGDRVMVTMYQKLLDVEISKKKKEIIKNYNNSESDYYKLVWSLYEGNNGFTRDKEQAYKLMEEGIGKGYRSLYWMYSNFLREKSNERYFDYLLEYIKDVEKELHEEFSFMESSYCTRAAVYLYEKHKDYWLTDKYRLVAEAYLTGFGVKQDIKKAESYIWKALSCDSKDRETTFLLAKLYNGEYGARYINYSMSISKLEALPLEYMDNKYPYALLGDAYIGKSLMFFFKASNCYENYPDIDKYESALRKRYCQYRIIFGGILALLLFIPIILLIISNI